MSMMLSIRVPVRRILAPFLKDGYLRFVDVIDLNSFFDDSVIVRECRQRYFGLLKYREEFQKYHMAFQGTQDGGRNR